MENSKNNPTPFNLFRVQLTFPYFTPTEAYLNGKRWFNWNFLFICEGRRKNVKQGKARKNFGHLGDTEK